MKINSHTLIESVLRIIVFIFVVYILSKIFDHLLGDVFDQQKHSGDAPREFFIRFFAMFFLMWAGISCIISYVGGWLYLSKYFKGQKNCINKKVKGRSLGMSFGYLPPASYNNCLKIFTCKDGIHIKSTFLFRLFHPPLYIPWEKMKWLKYSKIWIFKTLKVRVGEVSIRFYGKTATEINDILAPGHGSAN